MTASTGIDQELVVHVFAPLDGPHAEAAWAQMRTLWAQARERLGITELVPIAGAREILPDERIEVGPDQVVACAQNRGADFQIIARRIHDILNVSLVLATPLDRVGQPRRTILTPGWREFERWWRELSAGGVDAAIGLALVFQAETDLVDGLLPRRMETHLPALWSHWEPRSVPEATKWAVWESDSPDDSARRAFFVAGPEQCYDNELTTWTWSDGGTGLPALARYVMHAAKLRYQYRLLEASTDKIRALSAQARTHADEVKPLLRQPDSIDGRALATELSVDEGDLAVTLSDLEAMARTVEIACVNMTRSLRKPFSRDEVLGAGLRERIHDESFYLQNTLTLVRDSLARLRDANQVADELPRARRSMLAAEPRKPDSRLPPPARPGFGFCLDIVGYGQRDAPGEHNAQDRLADLVVHLVVNLGYEIAEVISIEKRGDQVLVVIPPDADVPSSLATLISSLRSALAADNRKFAVRMRVRAVATMALFSRGALGVAAGGTEIGRLIDSQPLRKALDANPNSDVALLISEWLYEQTVARGYEQLLPFRFERCRVRSKEYDRTAWLWIGDR